jgi:hypothetical protein
LLRIEECMILSTQAHLREYQYTRASLLLKGHNHSIPRIHGLFPLIKGLFPPLFHLKTLLYKMGKFHQI